ncbi:MAG TPA: hypothetical protein HA232_03845 [Methanocellales archaeon]|jgi:hypothetical protein|nr:hypothetical protein [Methanocellales archaeon]
MNRIVMMFGVGLIFAALSLSLVVAQFQHHELQGKFGDSAISLAWYDPNHLRGYISGGKVGYADCSWEFSADFRTLTINTSAGRASQSYTISKASSGVYKGVMPSAFGMGVDVSINIYADRITGNVGLDAIDVKVVPPLGSGEVRGIW